jgi:hypothetical protein
MEIGIFPFLLKRRDSIKHLRQLPLFSLSEKEWSVSLGG